MSFLDASGQWASVSGTATVDTDRSTVHKYYSPALKAWLGDLGDGKHDGGPDDPRIGVIRIKSLHITYGITGKTLIGRALDIAKGIATGETPGYMRLRDITESQLESVRSGGI
jgi:general stress protein 26